MGPAARPVKPMPNRPFPCLVALLLGLLVLLAGSGRATAGEAPPVYDLEYRAGFAPARGVAELSLTHTPRTGRISRLRMDLDPERYRALRAEGGTLERKGRTWTWIPDARRPSTLHWEHVVNRQRRGGGYDARLTRDWVIVRGDNLFPAARVVAPGGAESRTVLRFDLPEGWTNVDTPYPHGRDRREFVVENPERRFERPVGWMIAGAVGTRREVASGMEVSIAGPREGPVRRNEALAFINLVAPEMERAFGTLPEKVLIVSAGDPMWRGGLSGPRSLYVHSSRPLISENGTSTLVHELVHMVTRIRGGEGDDWIAEGTAEFYSITLMHRAGLLSDNRRDRAFAWMENHGRNVKSLLGDRSAGPVTARAVTLFRALDREIQQRSRGEKSLDDVMRRLVEIRTVSREDLAEVVRELTGRPSAVLDTPLLR